LHRGAAGLPAEVPAPELAASRVCTLMKRSALAADVAHDSFGRVEGLPEDTRDFMVSLLLTASNLLARSRWRSMKVRRGLAADRAVACERRFC